MEFYLFLTFIKVVPFPPLLPHLPSPLPCQPKVESQMSLMNVMLAITCSFPSHSLLICRGAPGVELRLCHELDCRRVQQLCRVGSLPAVSLCHSSTKPSPAKHHSSQSPGRASNLHLETQRGSVGRHPFLFTELTKLYLLWMEINNGFYEAQYRGGRNGKNLHFKHLRS